MTKPAIIIGVLGLALSGCASTPKPAGQPTPPRSTIVAGPQVMASAGLEGVIGSRAAALIRRFGRPRIDLAEGDARKLQFAGTRCVLDIYLYPLSAGAEPTATHVEARLQQGGAAVDRGACIRELEPR